MRKERKVVFGQMLDVFRKEKNMTMDDLGKTLNRTKSTISRWISGERYPKIEEVEQIAALFNTDTETLLFGAKDVINNNTSIIKLDKTLGKNISMYRKTKKISKEHLAKDMEISLEQLNQYEKGSLPFSVQLIFNFAEALNVTFDDLFPTTTTEHFDEIPAILDIDEKNNTITTASGKKYVVDDKEMQQAKDFLEFLSRK
ncbi:helix-turn-helix domain-containing protein [Enterococcus faecalis]|uniref:helix-turn-helix domain-containing protein n=1 Tax=Enterococcus faecalis TaxID=1351 RepID=UPI0035ECF504